MSGKPRYSTLVEMLEHATQERTSSLIYRQLDYSNDVVGEEKKLFSDLLKPSSIKEISYCDFLKKVKSLSTLIQTQAKSGDRALLIFEPGINFIAAFFATLFAGVIAVPVYPPKNKEEFNKLSKILADSKPSLFLLSKLIHQNFEQHGINKFFTKINSQQHVENQVIQDVLSGCLETYEGFSLLISDAVDYSDKQLYTYWKHPNIDTDSVAFLQYTSGSTSDPKGVILTHRNLLNNLHVMNYALRYSNQKHVVLWLPPYHDMGLIAGLLEIVYSNCSATVLSPISFLENPLRWMWAINEYRATLLGAPNFGYDLCVKHFLAHEKEYRESFKLFDFSSLEIVACGAEPIRAETMESFSTLFSEFGLKKQAMYPCYGLAESTLYVTGVNYMKGFDFTTIDNKNQYIIKNGTVEQTQTHQKFVNCGVNYDENQSIKIVDPESSTEMENGKVGEVWLSSPSVAQGYWEKPELSQEVFHARVVGDDREYLRSGDLGFMLNGNLYITGRRKDVIILNGVNYYPQDVELACSKCHAQIRTGCVVAVNIADRDGQDRLVIIAETKVVSNSETQVLESIVQSIRSAIAESMGIPMYNALSTILLMTKGGILKTTSGKLRRQPTKQAFLNNKLPPKLIVHRWDQEKLSDSASQPSTPTEIGLAKIWKELTGIDPSLSNNFFLLGGSSMSLIQLKSRIQHVFNVIISLTDLVMSPTLQLMAKLVDQHSNQCNTSSVQISKRERTSDTLELSNSQTRFWFLHHLIDNPAIHNVFAGVRLKGDLDKQALENSITKLVERHESLRTSFQETEMSPMQHIHSEISLKLNSISLKHLTSEEEKNLELNKFLFDEVNAPFNLNEAPLLRANLIEMSECDHVLAMTFHHIIIDGWSMNLLVEELVQYYLAFKNHQSPILPQVLQYGDYTLWSNQQQSMNETQLKYWEEKLSNLPESIKLPTEGENLSKSFDGSHFWFAIPETLVNSLRKIVQSRGATLYMGMLTLFNILLYRYSEQNDIAIGTPVVNRQQHVELEALIGLLVNTLVIRNNVNPEHNFIETLMEIKSTVIEAFENQDVPFQKVVERLKDSRNSMENPLFQVMMAMHNPQRKIVMDNLETELVRVDNGSSMFNLTLELQEIEDGSLQCCFEYRTDLFKKETIERMAGNLIELLKSATTESDNKSISKLSFLSNSEVETLNNFGNITNNDLSSSVSNRLLHELIEEQAIKTPDNTAVYFQGKSFSYQLLDQKSDQLARRLRDMNHSKNPFIAISIDRSFELIVSLVAILKAGFAYLPLDPSYPQERLLYVLDDSQAGLLITQSNYSEKFKDYQGKVLSIDRFVWSASSTSTSSISIEKPLTSPNDLAYLIYTSGSTGNPKGVMLSHRNVNNTLNGLIKLYEMKQDDKFIHYSSYSFDVSLEEIFLPLITGASIIVANPNIQYQLEELVDLVEQTKATIIGVTPSLWHGIRYHVLRNPKSTESLRIVTIGNEPVDSNAVKEIQQMCPNATVFNVCGGTETCIDWSLFKVPKDYAPLQQVVPIGKPIPGVKLYVLDSNRELVPIGVPGELYVGGNGVGNGYWKNSELTSKSFIENPFQTKDEKQNNVNGKLFKTGDLVKWLPDGNMVFISRLDHQVKLRGFRVELGEIQNVMRKSGLVREAIVILQDDENVSNKQLVGYIVCNEGETRPHSIIIQLVNSYLEKHLPYYMIPSHIICIEKVPTTNNGKLDRRALPRAVDHQQTKRLEENMGEVDPADIPESHCKLRQIWSKVLKMKEDCIGLSDNFFAIGGNSILIAQLRSMVRTELGIQLELKTFFEKLTIQSMATHIETVSQ
ncbi:non-ribosomal peptide synthetase [Naegleria gruberi]|uniref:Non-ribosomal peptide synthetase n=1 Tax=Naegleria gruberi TaxID=5762 RepID=D2V677_NAEGR|nr:non-ribosomal peptide synthetase [Naegleria gruberi]EFC47786.1 non-ribosomal peptide synthetase [Naegleria gruberi]|eukprot:XP_002680530.1 non-ribosomal peptide synthetase [Naegleria gruberi strain NEG-M]